MSFRFGPFVLDTQRYELRSGTDVVHVEPQVFDVLAYLLTHRERVVSKDELLDNVWGSRFVTESTLTSRIKAARQAIGDDGQAQRLIQTIRGRGFRFVAPVDTETTARVGGTGPLRAAAGPTVAATLVGRADEVATLTALVRKARLVTVVGPGGVGKTTCAVEAAVRAATTLGLHIAFVDLVPARDTSDVVRAACDAVGLRVEAAEPSLDALCAALRHEKFLLVLDNFEHVLAASPVVLLLMSAAEHVHLLVTSRERLRLPAEQVLPLDPLSWHATDADPPPAVQLFESVAQRLDPEFAIDKDNIDDVRALCAAVDGLPLGIELVAAYTRLMPPRQLRRELGDSLSSLTADVRGTPARQRTLRDTIEWSVRLLTEPEREFLVRLAVFRSGPGLDAIERVCRPGLVVDTVTALGALVDKSLLHRRIGADGSPRFSMLELVREQAQARLTASPGRAATHERHAAYFHDLVRQIEERRWCELADTWMSTLNEYFADIEAALDYDFSDGDPLRAARTVAGMFCHWHRSWRLTAGEHWTTRALAYVDSLSPLDRGLLYETAGYIAFRRHRTNEARRQFQRALDCFDEIDHDRYRAVAMVDLAGTWLGDSDHAPQAIEMCERAVRDSRAIGELPLIAHAVNVLGELTRLHGDAAQAWAANREGLLITRRTGDELHQAIFEMNLSTLALHRGDPAQARELVRAALRRSVGLGSQVLVAHALYTAAGAELECGEADRAARLLGAAENLFDALAVSPGPGDRPEYQRLQGCIEAALGPRRLAELSAAGRRLTPSEAVAQALA